MRKALRLFALVFCIATSGAAQSPGRATERPASRPAPRTAPALLPPPAQLAGPAATQSVRASFAKLPLSFEENRGQTDKHVQFLSHGAGYDLFLTGKEAVLALRNG